MQADRDGEVRSQHSLHVRAVPHTETRQQFLALAAATVSQVSSITLVPYPSHGRFVRLELTVPCHVTGI